jgi:hypothetical protein
MSLGVFLSSGALAVPTADEVKANDRAMGAMIVEARAFLASGGVLSWRDWREMDESERSAFVEAGRINAAERASMTGVASQSLAGALQVAAEADGGEAIRAVGLEAALQSVVASAQGTGAPR